MAIDMISNGAHNNVPSRSDVFGKAPGSIWEIEVDDRLSLGTQIVSRDFHFESSSGQGKEQP